MSHLIDFADRRRERSREQRRWRWRVAVIAVGVVALLAAVGWGLALSPVFSVKKVVVSGHRVVSDATIRRAAQVPLNVPLARVDTGSVASRVARIPGLWTVEVGVALPDAVTIRVVERPVSYVTNANKAFQWVDPAGQVFNETPRRPAGSLLVALSGSDERLMRDVATVANAIPPKLRGQTRVIAAPGPASISLTLKSGSKVVWGSAEESELKGKVAQALLNTKASVYDVSAPTHPTTRK